MTRYERDDAEDGHLEEWDTIAKAVTKLVRKKSHTISKRATNDPQRSTSNGPSLFEKMKLNPGKFIKKATDKGTSNLFATYFTYHGSLTTPGIFLEIVFCT